MLLRPRRLALRLGLSGLGRSTITSTGGPGNPLSKHQADELALRLTSEERAVLVTALREFEAKKVKDEYEGQLAAHRWRSKFGRPSKVPVVGDVDPTGTYCPVPDDWFERKRRETVPKPTPNDLFHLLVANSIPFVGFGFLDNFIMITAGDYIDHLLGAYVCLSTMAAAALGNTISDVIGIGSAFYVERFAERVGFQPPKLTPLQLDLPASRRASNMGRVLGITVGCLIGMFPLLFIKEDPKKKAEAAKLEAAKLEAAAAPPTSPGITPVVAAAAPPVATPAATLAATPAAAPATTSMPTPAITQAAAPVLAPAAATTTASPTSPATTRAATPAATPATTPAAAQK